MDGELGGSPAGIRDKAEGEDSRAGGIYSPHRSIPANQVGLISDRAKGSLPVSRASVRAPSFFARSKVCIYTRLK